MKTKYEYIEYRELMILPKRKTKVFDCVNTDHDNKIGTVSWLGRWRQYGFKPLPDTMFSAGCLRDIADFIKQLMDDRKKVVTPVVVKMCYICKHEHLSLNQYPCQGCVVAGHINWKPKT